MSTPREVTRRFAERKQNADFEYAMRGGKPWTLPRPAAGRGSKRAMVRRRFGKTGKPVNIPAAIVRRAKAEGRRLYEDGSLGPRRLPKPPVPRRHR